MIRPLGINPDGTVSVYHEEADHAGRVPLTALRLTAPSVAGRLDGRAVVITCPVAGCGAASTHPLVGDATARREAQQLIVRAVLAANLPGVPTTWAALKPLVRAAVVDAAGAAAWRWESDDPTG